MSSLVLPLFIQGEVVKGFGRGSKDLGCPTANYSLEVVQSLPKNLEPGVYYGWAQVDNGPVHKMETHIMHKFEGDFYGSILKISLLGYLRGEKNFSSLDDLIEAIKQDIANAEQSLETPDAQNVKCNEYFTTKKV
ncbi:hypothetical protein OBRU01_06012 [Operophtera brumata]|uniref:riboflavin kinase n=1 Tax=Operophtera brumata TaxID=104452 RepID=A0A0L7LMY2_OPEBR|nr:hypothetical protein OBRU01_06012 [Operophtera brumata]